ncbi:unnamed protein product [Rhodiola kirilowii]
MTGGFLKSLGFGGSKEKKSSESSKEKGGCKSANNSSSGPKQTKSGKKSVREKSSDAGGYVYGDFGYNHHGGGGEGRAGPLSLEALCEISNVAPGDISFALFPTHCFTRIQIPSRLGGSITVINSRILHMTALR